MFFFSIFYLFFAVNFHIGTASRLKSVLIFVLYRYFRCRRWNVRFESVLGEVLAVGFTGAAACLSKSSAAWRWTRKTVSRWVERSTGVCACRAILDVLCDPTAVRRERAYWRGALETWKSPWRSRRVPTRSAARTARATRANGTWRSTRRSRWKTTRTGWSRSRWNWS